MNELTPLQIDKPQRRTWLYDGLLVLVILAGLYLRLAGTNWDEGQYLHPDERFLMFVESSIQPVKSLGEYFNTAVSSLNPHNSGHPLFVYGTWPIFAVRYLLEWIGKTGGEVYQLGRPLSALATTATVLLVYLLGLRLYDRRVGLLAATFAAFSVLDIQLSHFFKEDTFMTFFVILALYFAVVVATGGWKARGENKSPEDPDRLVEAGREDAGPEALQSSDRREPGPGIFRGDGLIFILFGLALGMAMASKINSFPMALALPLAVLIRVFQQPARKQPSAMMEGFVYLVLGGMTTFLTFRVLQPYAFTGPGFLGLIPNPKWLDNLRELQRLASADSVFGFPPSLQWADRPIWFAWENITRWGLGLPLGILAWTGFVWVGWRILKGEWPKHILLWGWTALYFIWQSLVFNPTMRYQLPVYPTLAVLAAWAAVALWDRTSRREQNEVEPKRVNWQRGVVLLVIGGVVTGTVIWAWAFSAIYRQPVTRIAASRWIYQNIPGAITLHVRGSGGTLNQPVPYPYDTPLRPDLPYSTFFEARYGGLVSEITLPKVVDLLPSPGEESLSIALKVGEAELGSERVELDAPGVETGSSQEVKFEFNPPIPLVAGEVYEIRLSLQSAVGAAYQLAGASLATESSWDDGLPLRLDGYDGYGGIYQGGLNFEMYWEDNPEKRERFTSILDQADYLTISSSRQWASVGRLPDHFPLSAAYYRALIGCPEGLDIERCYNRAQVGMYQGALGFDLVEIFQANPTAGPLVINDQASEEAFTVYDHPKVFIFRKSAVYNPLQVREILDRVDLQQLDQAADPSVVEKDLLLPPERREGQLAGGTWAELFPPGSLLNRYEWLAVILWYVSLAVLGLLVYPLVRLALPGLPDGGYPFARTVGLLLLSYLVWISGSFGLPVERPLITVTVVLIAIFGGLAAYGQRKTLQELWRSNRRYFLLIEGLFLALFLFGLLIRFGNPDLWHPWKGGEKPMDFSYFNAVLKSTTYPPYDPWFAGGYINYYYYGFVLVGVLVKWLGINPAVAYNLILPTLFGLMGLGAFSIGWNLRESTRQEGEGWRSSPWLTGGAASLGMVLLGNLGIVRMIIRGYQRLGGSGAALEEVSFFTRWFWGAKGFLEALSGSQLPYALADWYWFPSRAIPAPGDVEPITEFPFFTFLYADLHAHLIALPLTVLVLAWALSVVLSRGRWGGLGRTVLGFLLGGLAIGALRPTNTWDFYPYLAIGGVAIVYGIGRYYRPGREWFASQPRLALAVRAALVMAAGAVLVLLAHLLFQPYADWYGQGYNSAGLWQGTRTPTYAYLDHWGVFLFFISSWMAWETREWLASTPLSALRSLEPYKGVIQAAFVVLLAVIVGFIIMEIRVAWLVLILGVWAATLLFRPGMPDAKRAILFLFGTGLVLTLMVEVVVLQGDIGRMNTVFKFYLQSWTLFAVSAAAAFGWLLTELPRWTVNWRKAWQFVAAFLVGAAALYPLLGSMARIKDRMTPEAPHTLDGMAYMAYSSYNDLGTIMDLSQDYRAIRWLQENVSGSPVIVEANMVEYHWGTRFTIYTGLPNVVGWNWHQRQQRAVLSGPVVEKRVEDVNNFYRTTDLAVARDFLRTYDVSYIILGQLERVLYQGEGLEKFTQFEGVGWREVYRDLDTVIYQVVEGELAER